MVRAPCCEKMGLKKGPWTPEEDHILITHIQRHGHGNWRALPKQAGLLRCGKSCRLRWVNYLRPDIKRGSFTKAEEDTIISLHKLLGNRWSAIAAKLPGRTDNEIKNVWHTHLKKRLTTTTATDTSVQAPKQSPEMHPTDCSAAVCADNEYNYYSPSISCSAVDDVPNDGLLFSNDMDESFLDDKFWMEAAVWMDDVPNDGLLFSNDMDESFLDDKFWMEAAVWMDDLDFRNLQVPCADPSHLEGSVDIWVKLAMEEFSAAQDLP